MYAFYIFWIIALSFSCFYSFGAIKIHLLVDIQNKNRLWSFHQWWFNFVGSIIGWLLLWVLFPTILQGLYNQSIDSFQFKDIFLLLIALLGITGHLPVTLFGIATTSSSIINKIFRS